MPVTTSIVVHAVEYHRNGIGGEPFYACRFTDPAERREFIATVFPPDPIKSGPNAGTADWRMENGWHSPRVAVLALDLLPSVEFGVNSWRGDNYADALYDAILRDRS